MKKIIITSCLILCMCVSLISKGFAQTYTITHQKNEVSFAKGNVYDVIDLRGSIFSMETGKPMLPIQNFQSGIYLYKLIYSNNKIKSGKFIKK